MELTESNLISIYKDLHQIPELALKEFKTHDYLLKQVKKLSVGNPNVEIKEPKELPTALLVRIQGTNPSKTIGYRTDIDALPVKEATGLPFASRHPGIMHACGHDVHMTVALGILDYFIQNQPVENMVFFFQPAEESKNGGKLAYEKKLFSGKWRSDEFYGLHDNPSLPAGTIGCRMGTLFAGTTEVDVDFRGKQGHAAYPQDANDMIVAASNFICQVQTIVSRNVDPIEGGVVTFGKFDAGTIRNVISGSASLKGTIRGLTQRMILLIDKRLSAIADGIAESFDCEVNLTLNQGGYLPVENNPHLTADFINFMVNNADVNYQETEPAMTGEDFGYLLSKIPGTMFWLGVGDEQHQLHSADLVPDTAAIEKGKNAITQFLTFRMNQISKGEA